MILTFYFIISPFYAIISTFYVIIVLFVIIWTFYVIIIVVCHNFYVIILTRIYFSHAGFHTDSVSIYSSFMRNTRDFQKRDRHKEKPLSNKTFLCLSLDGHQILSTFSSSLFPLPHPSVLSSRAASVSLFTSAAAISC